MLFYKNTQMYLVLSTANGNSNSKRYFTKILQCLIWSNIMSKLETPMTRWYWKQVGGTLIEEYPAVRRSKGVG